MHGRTKISLLAIIAISAASPALAKDKGPKNQPPPPDFARLVACQQVTDNMQRLACYDREVTTVSSANARGDLVVIDRQQIRQAKRSLFGLTLPNLSVLGDSGNDVTTLDTTIKSLSYGPDSKPIYNLAEGGRWQQLEFKTFIMDPAPGMKVHIKRAALGSYMMNVEGQIAVRVQRVN
jgi:hypothetical protein